MKIFGQVTDTNKDPMSLANIAIDSGEISSKIGTQTDLNGNFSLEDENITPDSKFKISYIGYKPQFIKASELQGNKIRLAEESEVLEDVVLTSVSTRPKTSSDKTQIQSKKQKFIQHLQDHKFIYAGIGGIAGIILIARAFKK
jgi:hypothetical protein